MAEATFFKYANHNQRALGRNQLSYVSEFEKTRLQDEARVLEAYRKLHWFASAEELAYMLGITTQEVQNPNEAALRLFKKKVDWKNFNEVLNRKTMRRW